MELEAIDTQVTLIDAWCRVENGAITESLIEEIVNGVRTRRPIFLIDIERRGHPLDWYVRVSKVERANIPRYYRRHMRFQLVRNEDATASVWIKEEARKPTIAHFLQRVRGDGVAKFMDMDEYTRTLFRTLLTTSIDISLSRFVKSRGYDSLAAAFGYIGSHIEKYDTEGKRVRYLASETWARYEWYVNALARDMLPFPAKADDILNYLPRLVWEDEVATVTETTDTTTAGNEPTVDTSVEPGTETPSEPVSPTETSAGA